MKNRETTLAEILKMNGVAESVAIPFISFSNQEEWDAILGSSPADILRAVEGVIGRKLILPDGITI